MQTGKRYSIEECKARLDGDMLQAVEQVERCHPGLPVEVLAAFGDTVYNMGRRLPVTIAGFAPAVPWRH